MKPHTFRYDYKLVLTDTIKQMVKIALAEDLNTDKGGSDITAELIPESHHVTASLVCRKQGILCGKEWFNEVFRQVDPDVNIKWSADDGDNLTADQELCTLQGSARAIMTGERSAMNFLQTLSGTATETGKYVTKLEGTDCRLLDTRKTLPGFRLAQKYAVTCGGGYNHRTGLFDAFLIKENHILTCGGIKKAIQQANKNYPEHPVEVEVEDLGEFRQALVAGADVIMLDNFSNEDKVKAVALNQEHVALEASGNITLETLAKVAKTGVDYISIGAITKNISALDLSLRVITAPLCH
ncbi:MAG: carboxylating nicotinate-nucleotide diphosphorylase [Gammaproteobacteria bacterium]|nr:carboxylating nicotinate-nucleotide diphosphorylase [Gammaproteobacteria bacterium]